MNSIHSLTTFKAESRLLTVGREALVSVDRAAGAPGRMLVAVTSDGFRTDYPISHDGKTILWDHPEWFSERFKERARAHVLKGA